MRPTHEAPPPEAGDAPAARPASYPDETGFAARRLRLARALASVDLSRWRTGYFEHGNDPGKYLPLHVMARLSLDPKDKDALRYINDERAPSQHFHFVMVNWARLIPMFRDALTEQTMTRFIEHAGRADAYTRIGGKGTENHKVMELAAGVVLPDYLDADTLANRPAAEAQQSGKDWLRWYVRNLYHVGQSEWDSSTYLLFDINAMLNIYDFSKDEECRLLARAALDWYLTMYVAKYTHGTHAGPKERGWTDGPMHAITDTAGWLWFGSRTEPSDKQLENARYAFHAALSAYRPNAVIFRIASRDLPEETFVVRSSKPNYWHGLNSAPLTPVANISQEQLLVHHDYTLGTLWYGEDFCTQLTRHQLVVTNPDGTTYALTGSQPGTYRGSNEFDPAQKIHTRWTAGQGTHIVRPDHTVDPVTAAAYVQYAQVDGTVVCMAEIPHGDENPFTYYTTPVEPTRAGEWYVMDLGAAYAAIFPLSATVEHGPGDEKFKQPVLRFPAMRSGWVLHVVPAKRYRDLDAFKAWLVEQKIDREGFERGMVLDVTTTDGRAVRMAYARGAGAARTTIDGRPVTLADWPLYESPYINHTPGVLSVNDGREGFVIDFTGEQPVYRPWNPTGVLP